MSFANILLASRDVDNDGENTAQSTVEQDVNTPRAFLIYTTSELR